MATFSRQVSETLAVKLKEARLATGLSTRAVADKLSRRYPISHTSIANYEGGRSSPPIDVLAALASAYERPLNWFLETGGSLSGVRYRNIKSKVRIQDRHRYEGAAKRLLEAYRKVEQRLGEPLKRDRALRGFKVSSDDTGRVVAERLRDHLGLGHHQPVASIVEVLERLGIRTIELATDIRIDGLAAHLDGEDVVVLNPGVSNDRARMNAAHELGHVLFGDCVASGCLDHKTVESRAYEFASFLLIPWEQLDAAFNGRSMLRLVEFKERYGIALSAMIYRAEKVGRLDAKTTKWLWIQFAKRGWRMKEPGYVWRDRAVRFERLVESAIRERVLTWREMEALSGVPAAELRRRIDEAIGYDHDEEGGDEEPRILQLA